MSEPQLNNVNNIISILQRTKVSISDSTKVSSKNDRASDLHLHPQKRTRKRTYSTKLIISDLIKAGAQKGHRPPSPVCADRKVGKSISVDKSSHIKREGQTKTLTPLKRNILEHRNSKQEETSHSWLEQSCSVHNRHFARYCNQFITPEIVQLSAHLLADLFRFQDRAYTRNPIKAVASRRFVVGFNETQRQLNNSKLKLLLIAPDLECPHSLQAYNESMQSGNKLLRQIDEMKAQCRATNVPCVFAARRRKMGFLLSKKVPVSCVGIISYEGSEESAKLLIAAAHAQHEEYEAVRCSEVHRSEIVSEE